MIATVRRENRAVFASGMTGCGKSQLLWDWFTSRHPRRVSYDPVGDTFERNPRAVAVRNVAEFRRHLERALTRQCDTWHFVIWGDPEEAAAILDLLAPSSAPPDASTLGRALGGVLFECGEIDTLATNDARPLAVKVRSKWQRARHSLLSFAVATQAPALVSRVVTANSHEIYAFMHSEHTSIEYFRVQIGARAADAIARLQQYEFIRYVKGAMAAEHWVSDWRRGRIERRKIADIPLGIGAAAC